MARVMVVDDAYSELQLMESILRSAGHEVIPLTDGDRLEDRVAAERPDVVPLDVVTPRRNGFDALRGLRRDERTRATRVLVVSSKNQQSDRAREAQAGCGRVRRQTVHPRAATGRGTPVRAMTAGLADAPPAPRACLSTVTVDHVARLAERLMASLSCFKLAA